MSQLTNVTDIKNFSHLGIAKDRLKDKKVLVVLDDVDRLVQVEALAKETSWFGPGTRIIITTQDQRVLKASGINHIHKELSCEVVSLVGRLPLGLKVMGSYFRGTCEQDLAEALPKKIVREQSVDEPGKRQFLTDAVDVCEVLSDDRAESSGVIGITVKTYEDIECTSERAFERLYNLQFLRILGKGVNPRSMNHISQKLRVLIWPNSEITCFLSNFNPKFLVKLEMMNSKLKKLWEETKPLNNLKWMNLSRSRRLEELPDLSTATNLYDLDLSYCSSLVKLPSSSGNTINLQSLDLSFCSKLVEIPPSIGNAIPTSITTITSLTSLDLSGCSSMVKLSDNIETFTEPNHINLSGCSSLVELPSSIGNAINLQKLNLSHCSSLVELPFSIGSAINLQKLDLSRCSSLVKLPSSIGNAINFHKLNLDRLLKCSKLEVLR
ncbi:unnamed protein product [Brassica oleracea]